MESQPKQKVQLEMEEEEMRGPRCPNCGEFIITDLCSRCGPTGPVTEWHGRTTGAGIGGGVYEVGGVPLGSEGQPDGIPSDTNGS